MRKKIKNNYIFTIYVITQLFVVLFSSFSDTIIGDNYNFTSAVVYHLICLFFFIIGYMPTKYNFKNFINQKTHKISKKFPYFAILCITTGLVTSIATIGTIVSPTEYLQILLSGSGDVLNVRLESGEGGLGGILKMLNYLPLGIFLISSSYYNFLNLKLEDKKMLIRIKNISLIASIIKIFFSLDRLTILAILLVLVYENAILKKIKTKIFFGAGIMIFLLSFITSSRMNNTGILEFLTTYFKLSLVNYQLVIDNYDNWTYGWNTFLMPMWYILKFFNINKEIPIPTKWVWNPAQYFNSSFYVDFGVFSLILYVFIGSFVRKVQSQTLKTNALYVSLYFIVVFSLSTFISVPFIRGIEFWVLICLAVLCSKFIKYENSF